jgi:large subunit ribosomal protein L31
MRKDIHPKYKELTVKIGNDEFKTMSTYPGDVLIMDIDYRKHPAWAGRGVIAADESNQNVSAFNKKFGNINFGLKK